jgi:hypothetical protein
VFLNNPKIKRIVICPFGGCRRPLSVDSPL